MRVSRELIVTDAIASFACFLTMTMVKLYVFLLFGAFTNRFASQLTSVLILDSTTNSIATYKAGVTRLVQFTTLDL